MTHIAGIDWATTHVTAAFIPLDKDAPNQTPTYRHERIHPGIHDEDRIRNTRHAVRETFAGIDCQLVYVERPVGFSWYTMLPVYGAIIASLPWTVQEVNGIRPNQWRAELAIKIRRGAPKGETKRVALEQVVDAGYTAPDHHHAEALLIALAGRQINDRGIAA